MSQREHDNDNHKRYNGPVTKQEVKYRDATMPGRRCENCAMWRQGSCTLVVGHIEWDHVCDHFEWQR